uniref:Uncharacterized protein n=1 Tax=Eutreptiella gymnastica TaxID=73025 RepID=A0A7S1J5V0_9EUGL
MPELGLNSAGYCAVAASAGAIAVLWVASSLHTAPFAALSAHVPPTTTTITSGIPVVRPHQPATAQAAVGTSTSMLMRRHAAYGSSDAARPSALETAPKATLLSSSFDHRSSAPGSSLEGFRLSVIFCIASALAGALLGLRRIALLRPGRDGEVMQASEKVSMAMAPPDPNADRTFMSKVAADLAAGVPFPDGFAHDPLTLAAASGILALADVLPCLPSIPRTQPIAMMTLSGGRSTRLVPTGGSFRIEPTMADLMSINGVMPEVINGRVAQLSFIAGIAAERATGETLPQQFADYPVSVLAATVLVTLASFMPKLRNATKYTVDPRTKSGSIFSARAELVNSRAAMIGLGAAIIQESLTGHPLLG